MPQTANQRNRQPIPQPLPQSDPAEQTPDHEYALVSVLYHSLQGVQACEQYIDDAERAGDDELQRFFEECRDQQAERAARAKQLLVSRVDEDEDEADEEDDEEDDDDEDAVDTERAPD
jgi:hypothetical protein